MPRYVAARSDELSRVASGHSWMWRVCSTVRSHSQFACVDVHLCRAGEQLQLVYKACRVCRACSLHLHRLTSTALRRLGVHEVRVTSAVAARSHAHAVSAWCGGAAGNVAGQQLITQGHAQRALEASQGPSATAAAVDDICGSNNWCNPWQEEP